MAIFNSSNAKVEKTGKTNTSIKSSSKNSSTTIITEGSSIKGEMNLVCDLYVDGHFDGVITSEKSITIGKNGKVNGDMRAQHLIVQGLLEGTIDAERIEIKETGRISGSIVSSELVIESRGIFEGDSKIKESIKPKKVIK